MALVYVKTSSGRKKLDARAQRKLDEHKAYVRQLLAGSTRERVSTLDEPQGHVRRPNLAPLSNDIGGVAHKKSIDDHRWKRSAAEPAHVVKEIEAKKRQLAPAYSKGAYQYISPETDLTALGRKL